MTADTGVVLSAFHPYPPFPLSSWHTQYRLHWCIEVPVVPSLDHWCIEVRVVPSLDHWCIEVRVVPSLDHWCIGVPVVPSLDHWCIGVPVVPSPGHCLMAVKEGAPPAARGRLTWNY
ncbi:unnamed protein product [Boreogadus saida]